MNSWNSIQSRLTAMWDKQIIDRCSIAITAPKNGVNYNIEPLPESNEDRIKYWTDGEWVLKRKKKLIESTYYCGDAFPQIMLDLGAAGHAGFFRNAKYEFRDTVWFFPFTESIDDALEFDENSFLYRKTLELAKYLTNESKNDYLVSMPDTCGNLDALAHIRGTTDLMIDMIESPDEVALVLDEIQSVWEKIVNDSYEAIKANNFGGSSIGWLDLWAPGKMAQMQCDLSVMIDTDTYNKFAMPELKKQSAMLECALYHFDGVEQVRHLDSLLSLDNLKIIQWQRVAGQSSVLNYLDSLKKIQAAGKCLQVMVYPNEIERVMSELSSKGLHLRVKAKNPQEAEDVLKVCQKLTHE